MENDAVVACQSVFFAMSSVQDVVPIRTEGYSGLIRGLNHLHADRNTRSWSTGSCSRHSHDRQTGHWRGIRHRSSGERLPERIDQAHGFWQVKHIV